MTTCLMAPAIASLCLGGALMVEDPRPPRDESELRYWLEVMAGPHGFNKEEIAAATGLTPEEAAQALARFGGRTSLGPARSDAGTLRVLPYPGGRHPRLGFLDGAIDPQRETKISLFPPWPDGGYAVADVPEAIFSNLGLTYLAHTHIPTIWDDQGVELTPLEWTRHGDGSLSCERTLPNKIRFTARVVPFADHVALEQTLTNGTDQPLTGLRVQECVMLGRLKGFDEQSEDNKLLKPPYSCARSTDGRRWILSAFVPSDRSWTNPPVPCIHSDPRFPDCMPGATVAVLGRLSFYEGQAIDEEIGRIEATGWRETPEGALDFEGDIREFEAAARVAPVGDESVVFLGSSTIRLWELERSFPELPVVNRGFGGSRMDHAAYFAPRILKDVAPRMIVVYEGDNDLNSGRTAEQVGADFERLLSEIRKVAPETRVLALGIKPSPSRWNLYPRMREANRLLGEIARKDGRAELVDLGPLLLGPDGQPVEGFYQTDGLHLSSAGYRVWSAALAPHLRP